MSTAVIQATQYVRKFGGVQSPNARIFDKFAAASRNFRALFHCITTNVTSQGGTPLPRSHRYVCRTRCPHLETRIRFRPSSSTWPTSSRLPCRRARWKCRPFRIWNRAERKARRFDGTRWIGGKRRRLGSDSEIARARLSEAVCFLRLHGNAYDINLSAIAYRSSEWARACSRAMTLVCTYWNSRYFIVVGIRNFLIRKNGLHSTSIVHWLGRVHRMQQSFVLFKTRKHSCSRNHGTSSWEPQ